MTNDRRYRQRDLVLAAAVRRRLARLDYDVDRLGALMAQRDWTTVQRVSRTGPTTFDSGGTGAGQTRDLTAQAG